MTYDGRKGYASTHLSAAKHHITRAIKLIETAHRLDNTFGGNQLILDLQNIRALVTEKREELDAEDWKLESQQLIGNYAPAGGASEF